MRKIFFRHSRVNFYNELKFLIKALKQKTSSLEAFRIDFQGESINKNDALKFVEMIGDMKELKELDLYCLNLETPKLFERLLKSLSLLKSLKTINLSNLQGKIDKALLADLVSDIMKNNRRLENVMLNSLGVGLTGKVYGWIDMEEVAKRNLWIKQITLPNNTLEEDCALGPYKWPSLHDDFINLYV